MSNFIQKAIKKPGALHKELGVAQDKPIPEAKLEKAAHAKGKLGQRARFAMTLKGLHPKKKITSIAQLREHAAKMKKG